VAAHPADGPVRGQHARRGPAGGRRPPGQALVEGALAWVECAVRDEIDAGDHLVVTAEVTALEAGSADEPLLFYRGRYLERALKETA
jgi:3-hydroxy-9,10-secoandrosta-1,3,5(10)-triene-9,17-dione monooxygenase reductase component